MYFSAIALAILSVIIHGTGRYDQAAYILIMAVFIRLMDTGKDKDD